MISVSEHAVAKHISQHGDSVVPEGGMCTVDIGECAGDGYYVCTADGLVCNAVPTDPPEPFEMTCDDGRDNDCDGLIDGADADCRPEPSPECEASSCGNFLECADEGICSGLTGCIRSAEGEGFCVQDTLCVGVACESSVDCGVGEVCAVDTCCGEPLCIPAESFCFPRGGDVDVPVFDPSVAPAGMIPAGEPSLFQGGSPRRR